MTRPSKEKWDKDWNENDLKELDKIAAFMRQTGAIDDYSAWKMAEQELYHSTRNIYGFSCK